jgi:hypothetical protein
VNHPCPPSPRLQQAIAGTLAQLAVEAEDFGVVLCMDPEFAARHLEQLQNIDRIAQSLRELAGILAASDPQAALSAVRLGGLRADLEKALAA